jgi:Methyltransferase FkbM domain
MSNSPGDSGSHSFTMRFFLLLPGHIDWAFCRKSSGGLAAERNSLCDSLNLLREVQRCLFNSSTAAMESLTREKIRLQVKRVQSASLTFLTTVSKQTKISIHGIGLIASCSLLIVVTLLFGVTGNSSQKISNASLRTFTNFDVTANAKSIKLWRQNLRDQCQAATSETDMVPIATNQISGFSMPELRIPQPRNEKAVRFCRHVVMDFGANIGDTSGHLVDSGMISCDRKVDLNSATLSSHFNIETKKFELVQRRNKLTENLERLLTEQESGRGPEDYCYYGIEGNPHFTERLQAIEDHVMAIRPRPVQHMHFFTESVGAGEDGMTKLYLDTVNEKQNFWGSSIFKDHQDVRKSADGKDVELVAVPVMGYTIGKLMRMTLKAFDPKASAADRKGSHLLLKVDIEGGEYPLLHQAVEDGTLCEFVKMGNTADLFIEFHSAKVTGKHDFVGKTKEMKDVLSGCGVTFRNLAANWA